MDVTGGGGGAPNPNPPPPLVTKEVTTFRHKKTDPPAVLGSPLPVHVHGSGGGGGMMQHGIHSTLDTHSALRMDHHQCHSGSFIVITSSHKIVLLAAATTT